ncbi:MAG TPA: type II toxin-antitoxin system death-on-curing family toxin [Sphingobium sp.]
MPSEPRWISVEELIIFNRLAVEETGEPFLVKDQGLLESAWGKPQHHWHYGEEDVVVLAVALMMGVARNHAFEQGNKRTAFAAADAFLYLNGYELHATDYSEFADLIVQAITGAIEEVDLISVLAYSIAPIDD